MRFPQALRAALLNVDERNYRAKLEALREEQGSWQKVADILGVPRSTLYDWRTGYSRSGRARRIKPSRDSLRKIEGAVRKSRRAQLGGVDWKKLRITGTIEIGGGAYTRHEHMYVGKYFADHEDAVRGLATAYLAGDDALLQAAMDFAMSWYYIGDGDTRLVDVDSLDFG